MLISKILFDLIMLYFLKLWIARLFKSILKNVLIKELIIILSLFIIINQPLIIEIIDTSVHTKLFRKEFVNRQFALKKQNIIKTGSNLS